MASVVVNFAGLFRDMGTSAAVIHHQNLDDKLLDTVFWFNAAVGMVLLAAVVVLAVPTAMAFNQPQLRGVLMALSVSFPIAALSAVHQALLERALGFKILAQIGVIAALLGLAVGVIAALKGAGVYSLVLNSIVTASVSSLQLWQSSRWRPTLRWSAREFRSLWEFSGNLFGFQLVNYFARNVDTMLVGRFLGVQQLGWYNMGYRLMLFPVQNLSWVVARAMFPVLSRHQDDYHALGNLYLRMLGGVALITSPLMAGLWVLREPIIRVVLGMRWGPVTDVVGWLAPVGLAQSLLGTVGLLYMATGSTRTMMRWALVASGVIVLGMVIGLRWGYVGVAAGYAIANLLLVIPGFLVPFRIVGLKLSHLARSVGPQLLTSLAMATIVWVVWQVGTPHVGPAILLAASVLGGAIVYALIGWMLMRSTLTQVLPRTVGRWQSAKDR